jgi:hypothetical protein
MLKKTQLPMSYLDKKGRRRFYLLLHEGWHLLPYLLSKELGTEATSKHKRTLLKLKFREVNYNAEMNEEYCSLYNCNTTQNSLIATSVL